MISARTAMLPSRSGTIDKLPEVRGVDGLVSVHEETGTMEPPTCPLVRDRIGEPELPCVVEQSWKSAGEACRRAPRRRRPALPRTCR